MPSAWERRDPTDNTDDHGNHYGSLVSPSSSSPLWHSSSMPSNKTNCFLHRTLLERFHLSSFSFVCEGRQITWFELKEKIPLYSTIKGLLLASTRILKSRDKSKRETCRILSESAGCIRDNHFLFFLMSSLEKKKRESSRLFSDFLVI